MREVETQTTGNLLHRLGLRVAADAADRETDRYGGSNAGVKEIAFQIDLAVGDRNDVRRDVRRVIAFLRFDDRQRRERAAALGVNLVQFRRFVVEFGGALEQPAVQVEDVAGESFAARRPAQEQRNLTVGLRVLRKIVVNDERVPAAVAEVLAHGAAGIGRHELHRRGIARGGADDDGVIHRPVFLQRLDHADDGGFLLADGDVDAGNIAALLVDDGVEANGGLAGLAVADNQLALAAADGNHRVDRFQARLQGFFDRLAFDDTGRAGLDGPELLGVDGTLAVDRLADGVDNAAEKLLADGHGQHAFGAFDDVAFGDLGEVAENHRADLFLLQVQRHAVDAVRELQHFLGHAVGQAFDARDAVATLDDFADLLDVDLGFVLADAATQDVGDLFRV